MPSINVKMMTLPLRSSLRLDKCQWAMAAPRITPYKFPFIVDEKIMVEYMESKKKNVRVVNVFNGEDEEVVEEEEDEKIEQFFALIKSFREARNLRRKELNETAEEEEKKKKKRKLDGERSSTTWVPSFKWEDFTEDVEFRRLPVIFPSPCNNKKQETKEEEEEEEEGRGVGLDLKLAL